MKEVRRFDIGSSVFFWDCPDYHSKDRDILVLMDDLLTEPLRLLRGDEDLMFFPDRSKEWFINDALTSGVPMRAGKFLSPMFAAYLEMSITDLQRLDSLFAEMDEKHTYEFIIYKAYLENGGWYLTERQKMEAYQEYRRTRNYI